MQDTGKRQCKHCRNEKALSDFFGRQDRLSSVCRDCHGINIRKGNLENAHRRPLAGYIYMLQSIYGGPVKIGFTININMRMPSYQTNSPAPLHVVAIKEDDRANVLEAELLMRFNHLILHGEWLIPSRELINEANRDNGWVQYHPIIERLNIIFPNELSL